MRLPGASRDPATPVRRIRRKPTEQATCLLKAAVTNPELFADVYDRYGEQVLRFIARQTFDVQLAYDLHAEAFAVAFERRAQFRGTTAEEEQAWLFTIARREITALWRRGRVRREAMNRLQLERPALDDAAIERLEEVAELDTLRPVLAAAMDALSPAQREAVEMRVVAELGYEEIAARMDISYDVARARVSRGLRALHDALSSGDYAVGDLA